MDVENSDTLLEIARRKVKAKAKGLKETEKEKVSVLTAKAAAKDGLGKVAKEIREAVKVMDTKEIAGIAEREAISLRNAGHNK